MYCVDSTFILCSPYPHTRFIHVPGQCCDQGICSSAKWQTQGSSICIPLRTGSNIIPLSHSAFVTKLKSLARKIGKDPDVFSNHSFRRGGATSAFSVTNNHNLIKYVGDWLSDSYLMYNGMDSKQVKLLPTLMAAKVMTQTKAFLINPSVVYP